jgi:Protein of unknown function (DUF1194)
VLAADISRSVDEVKFQLQRSGYAAAFSDSRVIEAIRSGPNGRIAVELVEWSGPLSQNIVIDWMVISDDKTARLFGDHIVEASRICRQHVDQPSKWVTVFGRVGSCTPPPFIV